MSSIKLFIFDLDDTLIQSNINYSEIRYRVAELFTPPLSNDFILKTPILELLKKLREDNPEKYDEGYRRIDKAEKEAIKMATVIQGADRIPLILKKYDIQYIIFTNNSRSTADLYQTRFNFLKEFQILTREDFNNPKPDPEGLIEIIERYNNESITRENTVYVGDSYIDAIAAYRANIRFIWFKSRDINPDLIPTPPYAILTDWSNFESILMRIPEN